MSRRIFWNRVSAYFLMKRMLGGREFWVVGNGIEAVIEAPYDMLRLKNYCTGSLDLSGGRRRIRPERSEDHASPGGSGEE